MERKKVSFDEDKFVLLNLILSTPLCREVIHQTDEMYFKSKGVKVVLGWIKTHYKKYKECLGTKINDYYELETDSLDPSVKEQIQNILEHLSSIESSELHNIEYLKNRAYSLYRKKFYENQLAAANVYMENGELDKAEQALSKRFQHSDVVTQAKRLDDPDLISRSMELLFRDEDKDPFFKFEGRLGEFIGELEGGWLVSFVAPPKTGKTVMLVESLVSAIMQKKNTIFFSFEMPLHQIHARFLRRITGLADPGGGTYEVPVFDCAKNQDASCILPCRVGYGDLTDNSGSTPRIMPYSDTIDWTVCDVCRGTKEFVPASWKVKVKKDPTTESEFRKNIDSYLRLYAKYCRSVFFPSRSASIEDLQGEINALIERENFIPDVIIIDYADLMRHLSGKDKRLQLDDIWESLRALGQSMLVLVITASQTSKAAVDSIYIKSTDIAEDFSKIAKLDLGIGLAQTEAMKDANVLNSNIIAYRHGGFLISKVCAILQDPAAMQGHLDSEY